MASLAHADHDHHSPVHHQFEDMEQQNETYLVGMWSFLVTEVMFFGAMFLAYTLYRWRYQTSFWGASQELNVGLGALNTTILLLSSFTMAMGVHFAQIKDRKKVLAMLGLTMAFAAAFLFVKLVFEWPVKFEHHLFPGANFRPELAHLHGGDARFAEIYYSLYFTMTGLHGLHILIGIIIIAVLAMMWQKENKLVTEDYMPTEMIGLYWHFVDLVWIFLFPLFYLIPR